MIVAVIGASRGVGKALAHQFLQHGHQVMLGVRSGALADSSWTEEFSSRMMVLQTDLLYESSLCLAAEQTVRQWGLIDIVIVSAGILSPGDRVNDLLHTALSELRQMFEVNAIGILTALRGFSPFMKRGGVFAALTARGGTLAEYSPLFPAYTVTKTAANKMIQLLHNTVSEVQVIAIHPGRVNTDTGRTTAQIEPEESAQGIYETLTTQRTFPHWFLNYTGEPLEFQNDKAPSVSTN